VDDAGTLVASSASRIFEDLFTEEAARAARRGACDSSAWNAVEEAGLPFALLPEKYGGFGLSPVDALNLLRISAYHGAPVPLGETMFANWIQAIAGFEITSGPATFAQLPDNAAIRERDDGCYVAAVIEQVPWARYARTLVLVDRIRVLKIEAGSARITTGNAANGFPRDQVQVEATIPTRYVARCPTSLRDDGIELAGALLRSLEMAGALQRVLELTVQYSTERVQFGRPIGKFQAIQQDLAVLAGEATAAAAAARLAAESFGTTGAPAAIAAAKARIGEAAGIGAAIAHQIHGAMGYTKEHRLHLYTEALWTWRDEFGGEQFWQQRLGAMALAGGAEGFWPFVTKVGATLHSGDCAVPFGGDGS
jgi:acyl-CoA dehydrogenase